MAKPATNNIDEVLANKSIKPKQKVVSLGQLLLDGNIPLEQLIVQAKKENDINKATIIESLEYASKLKAGIINKQGFEFVTESLNSNAPRIKWESAKVIANTAHLFPKMLNKAVANLLNNTEHPGSVVRWGAAGALSKILQCRTDLNKELIPTIEALEKNEQDNAIRKIYQQGLKKAAKQTT